MSNIKSHERPTCEVCLKSGVTLVEKYTRSPWPVVACNACGFVFLGRVPDYETLSIDLAWEKQHAEEKDRRRKTSRLARFDAITRFRLALGRAIDRARHRSGMPKTGRVLEIGCGGTIRVPEGPVPYGIEISEALSRKARPIFEARGGAVYHEPATTGIDRFPENFFDAIVMRSYLEHEAQPRLILERALSRLKPGGKILLRSPNFNSLNRHIMGAGWCGFRFPDHVNYFTPRSLGNLARSIGYEFRWRNWLSPFDDNLIVELRRPYTDAPLQGSGAIPSKSLG